MSTTTKLLGGTGNFFDERFGSGTFLRRNMRKVFPDHWSFMLGEIALYSFIIVLLSGVFLTFWFRPSMEPVIYDGSYMKLQDVEMSEAYASTLNITFDVRGGLLMRQIHHWSAILFVAAIMVHMLRVFFTGAFRKPREVNWLIGFTMFVLAFANGFIGYGLPDDMLSGTGLKISHGMMQGIPVVGTYLTMFAFGGEWPGHDLIPRLFTIHVLLIPGILLALVAAHVMILWHQKHTQYPGKARTEKNVMGGPAYPSFAAKTTAYFLFTFAVVTLMSTVTQINPIWLYGPYNPGQVSAGAQPDFYMGFLEGAVRIMPGWEIVGWGYTLTLSVFIPAIVVPGALFTGLALYPFIEKWITGDQRNHHLLDRPRNAPTRTAVGAGGVTFYGVLWAAGGNDVIATSLHIDLFTTTWIFRVLFFAGPVIAFIVTKRICLGLQHRDLEVLHHGVETGTIKRLPSGEYIEVEEAPSEDERAVLGSKKEIPQVAARATDENDVPDPRTRRLIGKLRARLNRFYTADDMPATGQAGHPPHGELEAGEKEEVPSSHR